MILALLCFAIPAFGGYFALVVPIRAIVMTRNIEMNQSWQSPAEFPHSTGVDLVRENITLLFFYTSRLDSAIEVTVARTFQGTATDIFFLNSMNVLESWAAHGSYDYSWLDLSETQDDLIVTSDLPDARGILYVKAGQGNPSDVNSYAEAIPLTNGSHISAILSRRQRDLFSKNAQDIFGITTTFRSIMVNPVLLLQPDPSPPLDWAVSLRLRMRDDMNAYPTELVQDYTDASVLNGIATFGGFWTFVNGVFATVFGANLLYFLLRRRTLSALGIVHLFQRRKLTRNWNEDFPALHTEGGQPGSSSAGIVAFLRERLVDLDDEDSHLGDLEAQHPPSDSDQSAASKDEADTVSPLADEEIITQEVTATPP
ncbi:hypothetical protein B0H19DRAFT_205254 [Mycena capillaripes]|nr:hypothetical protein B0H19DRAFT_205254 [Mycena capillaripes]